MHKHFISLQEYLGTSTTVSGHYSRPPSRAAHDSDIDQITASAEAQLGHLQDTSLSPFSASKAAIVEGLHYCSATLGLARVQVLRHTVFTNICIIYRCISFKESNSISSSILGVIN